MAQMITADPGMGRMFTLLITADPATAVDRTT
jgi:hypothetical protein